MGTYTQPDAAAPPQVFRHPRVPPAFYLQSTFRPDREYVDGLIVKRNVGEIDHATLQKMVLLALTALEDEGGFFALQECRVQAGATRYRVPDVCLIPADRVPARIIHEAPLLCVEVLSPRDNLKRMRERCTDFLAMGVPVVWIFDPAAETAWELTNDRLEERKTGVLHLPSTAVQVRVEALFAAARSKKRRHTEG